MPRKMKIELLEAPYLQQFEISLWALSFTLSTAVGFFTAYMSSKDPVLLWTGIAFTLLSSLFVAAALLARRKMKRSQLVERLPLDRLLSN